MGKTYAYANLESDSKHKGRKYEEIRDVREKKHCKDTQEGISSRPASKYR